MYKYFIILFSICSFLIVPYHTARAEQILAVGDSIMYGYAGATDGPLPTLSSYTGMTYHNSAVNGTCITDGTTNLASWLSTYTPERVYCNYGTNDIRTWANSCYVDRATWLTRYSTLLSLTQGAGATLYALQITPSCYEIWYPSNNIKTTVKTWNAYLEDWCVTNNVPMAPSYQDLCNPSTASEDCLYYDPGDGLHISSAGDVVYGYLLYNAAVPTQSRDWGDSSYPTMGHDSWSWWIITGTGSVTGGGTDGVTGKNDGGTLSLNSGASAVSPVLAIISGGRLITISTTLTQGAVTISYRTSSAWFARDAVSPSWTTYTGAFTDVNECTYIQVKIETSGETTSLTDEVALDWSPVPLPVTTHSGTVSSGSVSR